MLLTLHFLRPFNPLHLSPSPLSTPEIPSILLLLCSPLPPLVRLGRPRWRQWYRRRGRRRGGGENFGFWSRLFSPVALAKEGEESKSAEWDSHGLPANVRVLLRKMEGFKRYKVSKVMFYDQGKRNTIGTEDSFFEMVSLRPGGIYTKAQLEKEVETLATCGMFEKVDLEARTNPDGTVNIILPFKESTWSPVGSFQCINVGLMSQPKPIESDPDMSDKEKMEYYGLLDSQYRARIRNSRNCALPSSVEDAIVRMMGGGVRDVTARMLQKARDVVQKWYHDNGYACAQVVNFGNLNTREIVCEVIEGDITKLEIQFLDKLGNVVEGITNANLVLKEVPRSLRKGHIFNLETGKQALRNLNALGLFSNIEVNPRSDENSEGGIIVEIKLKELDQKSAEVSTEWSIVPGRHGNPTLASIQPGGSVTFEHRNIKGLNRSLLGTITTTNFFNPQDDLSFKFEYVHPYLYGLYDPLNRTLRVSCFNSQKLSPVFTGGPGVDEIPPILVDRSGIKANITENFTRQSKFTYGLVMEEITTRDNTNQISTQGARVLPNGQMSADGPPTSLSGTGVDRMVFAQANITRDNTKFVNGATVGERNVFQIDQGLGIGSNFPFFNRHQLTITKFIPLRKVAKTAGDSPPPVLVLHGHYGGCVGDLPSYDAFVLGGPYSVRGYNMGELGAARNILEVAAELRVPVRNTHVYAFVEHGNDLGSSKDVKGNPTEVYRRLGHGSSYGVGVKLGLVRAEYAVDHNSGTGAVFFRFGERF
ncbi:Putative translocon at the outer envelope membrane of chloroplasts 75-III [Dionaea muscipula]